MIILKFIALVVGIWFFMVNVMRCARGLDVPASNLFMGAFAWAAFITMQWLI